MERGSAGKTKPPVRVEYQKLSVNLLQQFVELVTELTLQVLDVVITGAEVPELVKLLLKRPQRIQVLFALLVMTTQKGPSFSARLKPHPF